MASQDNPTIQPAGDSALLITFGSQIDPVTNRRVHALAHALEATSASGLGEAVPGYCTLLVHYDPWLITYAGIEEILHSCMHRLEDQPPISPRKVEISVHYGGEDGPDLEFVAAHNHLSVEEVIRRHSERDYPVYMMGFTPGFPYLGGLDPEIAAPRLATPRSRVPGGSVGIAGEQTGIYPVESPGGWRIIGRTERVLFDPRREPSCLLAPGDLVHFVPVDRLDSEGYAYSQNSTSDEPVGGALDVVSPGAMTTVQDPGRYGYERYGVPPAGAMDWLALYTANRLVGNDLGAAALEFALDPPLLRAEGDCLVAVTGVGGQLVVDGRTVGAWRAAVVRNGEVISIEPEERTGWGYLAVSGGIAVPLLMGSRATYLRGRFGGLDGRTLREGDSLPVGSFPSKRLRRAGSWLPPAARPAYARDVIIPVVPGPQAADFGQEGLQTFLAGEYAVSPTSDRMGYRLSGTPLVRARPGELLSQGIAPGSIQVPPDGQPIVLFADRPTAGGYPKIATVARVGLPLLAQAMPGSGKVQFTPVSVDEAQTRLRQMVQAVEVGMEEENED